MNDDLKCRCGHHLITHVNGIGRCTAYEPQSTDLCPCECAIPLRGK